MAAQSLSAFIDFEASSSENGPSAQTHPMPAAPQKVIPHTYHSVPHTPDETEREPFLWGENQTGPGDADNTRVSGTQTPKTPNDLEMSRPQTPLLEGEGVEQMQSFSNPPINRFRMVAVSLMNFNSGLNDSSPGPLIPYIESHYAIGYAVVSLIFISNALGFLVAAFFLDALRSHVGRARSHVIGNILMICGYIPIICTPPFPVVVLCFFFLGLGMAINLALGNVFAANLQNSHITLGAMHGSYGIGGTIGPLICTAMVTTGGLIWSRFYILTLSIALFNGAFAGWSFWNFERMEHTAPAIPLTTLEPPVTEQPGESAVMQDTARHSNTFQAPAVETLSSRLKNMARSFKNKAVLLGATFIFAYQGAEVSISGWVISFLITTRHGQPQSVGYVTAGFWGGITVGRFVLSAFARRIGEKLFVYGLVLGAAAFQLLVWFVPNIFGDAVAVSIVGLLLGPVFPCATVVFAQLIKKSEQVSGLSVISAFGSSGGALAPFVTGILAQATGSTFVLHPIAISLFGVMILCWWSLPAVRKRTE